MGGFASCAENGVKRPLAHAADCGRRQGTRTGRTGRRDGRLLILAGSARIGVAKIGSGQVDDDVFRDVPDQRLHKAHLAKRPATRRVPGR